MSLVNKLKTGLKTTALVVAALSALSFASCKYPVPPEPTPNNPPEAILDVTPTSGQALETIILMQLDGADLDGKTDILAYRIGEDKNDDGDIDDVGESIQDSSVIINKNVIFNTPGIKKIYGQVMDSYGAIGKAGPIYVDVSPGLEPPLNNPPEAIINVTPTSGQAPLETFIQLDGTDLDGKEDIIEYRIGEDKNDDGDIDDVGESIQDSSVIINKNVIFNTPGIKKIYGQVMDSYGEIGKVGPIHVNVSPESGPPTADLSGVNTDLLEEVEKVINLPEPEDPNPEDMPVPYISATSLDGKVTPILSGNTSTGYQLAITGNTDKIGPYEINLEFGTSAGGISNATLEGIITNLADISGQLQDNETDSPQTGIIKAYNSLDNSFLEQAQVDSSGNFDFQIDEVVSEIILQGRIMDGSVEKSYVRTVKLGGTQDYSGLEIRAVPHPSGDLSLISPIDFKTYMDEINFGYVYLGGGEYIWDGLYKWNFGEFPEIPEKFEKIVIVKSDPLTGSSFLDTHFANPSITELEFMANKINALNDVRAFVEGRTLPIQIVDLESDISSYANKIVVLPDDTIIPGGDARIDGTTNNGYINSVRIRIRNVSDFVISHEFGHAFIASSGEAWTALPSYTVMSATPASAFPGPADIKAGKLIYEDTYKGGERINDILGLDWLDD
jgi:PKD repeat protein